MPRKKECSYCGDNEFLEPCKVCGKPVCIECRCYLCEENKRGIHHMSGCPTPDDCIELVAE